jgi:hypothetical protein
MQSLFLVLGIGLARTGKSKRLKQPWIRFKWLEVRNLGMVQIEPMEP